MRFINKMEFQLVTSLILGLQYNQLKGDCTPIYMYSFVMVFFIFLSPEYVRRYNSKSS